eukprot:SAG31_NODE_3747_length_3927_cov_2.759404_2_plen_44_part_00
MYLNLVDSVMVHGCKFIIIVYTAVYNQVLVYASTYSCKFSNPG